MTPAAVRLDAVKWPGQEPPRGPLSMARFDLIDPLLSGNKWFKLQLNLSAALKAGADCIASFGGAWSNHLHALAAAGHRHGIATVGFVRAEPHEALTPTLKDAQRWGMQLRYLSRSDYRRRHEPEFVESLMAGCKVYWVPEGGANALGVKGCEAMGTSLQAALGESTDVCVVAAVGTGATLAGLLRSLPSPWQVLGISVLKGASDQPSRVAGWLDAAGGPRWALRDGFHRGGYARADNELLAFCRDFLRVTNVPLEPVYTGKMMMAIRDMMRAGEFSPHTHVVAVHSGGLQGARGFPSLGCSEEFIGA